MMKQQKYNVEITLKLYSNGCNNKSPQSFLMLQRKSQPGFNLPRRYRESLNLESSGFALPREQPCRSVFPFVSNRAGVFFLPVIKKIFCLSTRRYHGTSLFGCVCHVCVACVSPPLSQQ